MAYLQKEDYTISASIQYLNDILAAAAEASAKSEDVIRLEAELTAEAQIRAFVSSRYDIDPEFVKTAPDATRARMVIKCNVDMALYHLHFTINPRNVPKFRITAYEDCLEQLKSIQDGDMQLIGVFELEDPLVSTVITSNRKFISQSFKDRAADRQSLL